MRNAGTLDRRAVAAALLRDPGDLLVVTGLGAPSYDAAAPATAPAISTCGGRWVARPWSGSGWRWHSRGIAFWC